MIDKSILINQGNKMISKEEVMDIIRAIHLDKEVNNPNPFINNYNMKMFDRDIKILVDYINQAPQLNSDIEEAIKELQNDLNTQSDSELDHYGDKWKSWYNVRLNIIKQHISNQQNKIYEYEGYLQEEKENCENDLIRYKGQIFAETKANAKLDFINKLQKETK